MKRKVDFPLFFPLLFFCWICKLTTRSNRYWHKTMKVAGQCREDALLTARLEWLKLPMKCSVRDKEKSQSQAEDMEKVKRQWELICIWLTQKVTYVHGAEIKPEGWGPVWILWKVERKYFLKSFLVSDFKTGQIRVWGSFLIFLVIILFLILLFLFLINLGFETRKLLKSLTLLKKKVKKKQGSIHFRDFASLGFDHVTVDS